MAQVDQWSVFEHSMHSTRAHGNPFLDVELRAHFASPSGEQRTIDAFWDGHGTWCLRFSPDETGEWTWRTECSDAADTGLHAQEGRFQCVAHEGSNPLYRRGALRLANDRLHFEHADGTPFFWLADTAWNGVLRSGREEWSRYLKARREQQFTAIQFVSTQWRGCSRGPHDATAFMQGDHLEINPHFFEHLDPRIKAINGHGLIAAPVILWALRETDPGQSLSEENAVRIARYIVARWGAYQVVWLLGGDGHYDGEKAERWKRIGRAVFGPRHDRLVTMHPCGQSWVADEFNDESWFDFIGYQSGHGRSEKELRWLTNGPLSRWRRTPPRPIVNLEPNYEAHPAYQDGTPFADAEVRRAAYWSLLVAPTAGVTYGHNAIWPWAGEAQVPEGHERIGVVRPWHEALFAPGAQSMAVLHRFFASFPWWTLRPAPELLAQQPGGKDPREFIAAARSEDGALAIVYLPTGGDVNLRPDALTGMKRARWFSPRDESWSNAGPIGLRVAAPDTNDWLIVFD